ncbi:hypothetical protein SUGI_0752260 [Cryptomeria japonica]|nr:hypothetical protein SUGI_0752260 [Cryptomeria japonica]
MNPRAILMLVACLEMAIILGGAARYSGINVGARLAAPGGPNNGGNSNPGGNLLGNAKAGPNPGGNLIGNAKAGPNKGGNSFGERKHGRAGISHANFEGLLFSFSSEDRIKQLSKSVHYFQASTPPATHNYVGTQQEEEGRMSCGDENGAKAFAPQSLWPFASPSI